MLKKLMSKIGVKSDDLKQVLRERRLQELADMREMNSDERELKRFLEEQRMQRVRAQLAQFRKQRNKEFFHSKNITDAKNIFNRHKSIMKNKNLFQGQRSILAQKALFTR